MLIFGNPRGGTPVMKCAQTAGIDLPLRILVWEDEGGTVRVGYKDPEEMKDRHGIKGCDEVLRNRKGVLENRTSDATGPGS